MDFNQASKDLVDSKSLVLQSNYLNEVTYNVHASAETGPESCDRIITNKGPEQEQDSLLSSAKDQRPRN